MQLRGSLPEWVLSEYVSVDIYFYSFPLLLGFFSQEEISEKKQVDHLSILSFMIIEELWASSFVRSKIRFLRFMQSKQLSTCLLIYYV